MIVRRLRVGDLFSVLRIERACFRDEGYGVTTFLAHLFRDRNGSFVVEDDGGAVVGYTLARLSLGWVGRRHGGITSIAVAPAHRRQGIGRKLMERALQYLHEHHVEEADLEVRANNGAAQSLYESFGFRRASLLPHYYGQSADGLRMVLDLRAAGRCSE